MSHYWAVWVLPESSVGFSISVSMSDGGTCRTTSVSFLGSWLICDACVGMRVSVEVSLKSGVFVETARRVGRISTSVLDGLSVTIIASNVSLFRSLCPDNRNAAIMTKSRCNPIEANNCVEMSLFHFFNLPCGSVK